MAVAKCIVLFTLSLITVGILVFVEVIDDYSAKVKDLLLAVFIIASAVFIGTEIGGFCEKISIYEAIDSGKLTIEEIKDYVHPSRKR